MKCRKSPHYNYRKYAHMTFSELIGAVWRKHMSAIANNIEKNNALLKRLREVK